MADFEREDRYLVIKISDVEKYLNDLDRLGIESYMGKIDKGRIADGKEAFPKCAIAEFDWPEYELLWNAIEQRVENG